MRLNILPSRLALCRLPPEAPIPAWAWQGEFCSVTRTPEELSVVTAESNLPEDASCSRGWRVLQVRGPLDLDLIGILAGLAATLADAGVNIFTLSTFDTDYILVPEKRLHDAAAALRMAGHEIVGETVSGQEGAARDGVE